LPEPTNRDSKKLAELPEKDEVDPKNTHPDEVELDALSVIEADDDLLSDLDLTPSEEAETDAEIMAALDTIDPADYDDPVAPEAGWLIDVRELARKHGPFSAAQILQVVRELDVSGNEASR
jgi:hypothetical protein